MRLAIATAAIVSALVAAGYIGGATLQTATAHGQQAPKCQEDELIEGRGDFSHGRWERYACTHPDDVTTETIENNYADPTVYATVRGSVCDHGRHWKREAGIVRATEETCH